MRSLRYLLIIISILSCVSCSKDRISNGYQGFINVDGKRAVDIKIGYNDDIREFGLGNHNWCLFTEEQNVKERLIDINQQAAVISLSDSGEIVELELNVPGYGELYVCGRHDYHKGKFEKTGDNTYKVSEANYIERLENPKYNSSFLEGTLVFHKLVYNKKGSVLQLDMTLKLNREIRIVYDGDTPVVDNLGGRM